MIAFMLILMLMLAFGYSLVIVYQILNVINGIYQIGVDDLHLLTDFWEDNWLDETMLKYAIYEVRISSAAILMTFCLAVMTICWKCSRPLLDFIWNKFNDCGKQIGE